MPVVEGRNPVIRLLREGLQSGDWQWALVKSVPRLASASMFGVLHLRMPLEATNPIIQIIDSDE